MRQTLLNFRDPNERTAEYRIAKCNRNGHSLEYKKQIGFNQQGRSTNFSKERRFKAEKFYCNGTGESVFVGPGSYQPLENFSAQNKKACAVLMKKNT